MLGIQQDTTVLFSDFQHNGEMWTGTGDREFRSEITFEEPFLKPPIMQVSVELWDFDHETNQRAELVAEDIGKSGFTLVFKTWGDTRVARMRATWTAFGPVKNEDDWDVE
ncbi:MULTISPECIES: H-type lectin domain-containing protein [Halocynthiibacter]|uniref:H-type lectin domain-containing protein n=1 Tax=Halocynthiibacter halioticoli TaxID=2986804 RepID=A0AAE3IX04_9RHOB|nr:MULTISPECIES: H-type lectin domain-containing protein [Halocynthiibacter]MCV6823690.1 H-type lectin domain-containing protein [Halocynthiibacter halioticoli]MCW4056691.1 H-type lectin domain-containing protein [Halocynthiibacter sp. SDUM655004]MDE0590292.1 H-type lectin domain-containing protein [Halocynthiibacter sp. C4]